MGLINIYLNKLEVPFVYIQHMNSLKLETGSIPLKIPDEIKVNGKGIVGDYNGMYTLKKHCPLLLFDNYVNWRGQIWIKCPTSIHGH